MENIFYFIVIFVLLWFIFFKSKDFPDFSLWNSSDNRFNLFVSKKFFSASELAFFNELNKFLIDSDLVLFSKPRLADFIGVKNWEYKLYMTAFNRISSKHIDFILLDKYWNVKLLIELDDYFHKKTKAKKNDDFKNELFEYLWFPLVRFKVWKTYDFSVLNQYI